MAVIIDGNTCYDAWLKTSMYLISHPKGEDTNIIVNISDPCQFKDLPIWLITKNPKKFDKNGDNIRNVINTIFPYLLREHFICRFDFYKKYSKVFTKSKNKKWGTYFQRLISFGKGINNGQINQIENAISALNSKSRQRYFITFHTTASNIESNKRPLGGPCWQYGELVKNDNGKIDLVAVYRNQDYFNKALGNFIGLAKLLEFICIESKQIPGNLVIHSVHGYSSVGIQKLVKMTT